MMKKVYNTRNCSFASSSLASTIAGRATGTNSCAKNEIVPCVSDPLAVFRRLMEDSRAYVVPKLVLGGLWFIVEARATLEGRYFVQVLQRLEHDEAQRKEGG